MHCASKMRFAKIEFILTAGASGAEEAAEKIGRVRVFFEENQPVILQTGHVQLKQATKRQFAWTIRQLINWGLKLDLKQLEEACFQARVLDAQGRGQQQPGGLYSSFPRCYGAPPALFDLYHGNVQTRIPSPLKDASQGNGQ
jgi:hypothetical protein